MQFRLNLNKNHIKHTQSPSAIEKHESSLSFESQNDSKFKLPHESSLPTERIIQTAREYRKTTIKLPPINQYLDNYHEDIFSLFETSRCIPNKKMYSNLKHFELNTERPLYRIKKLSDSGKSTTNESETKSISKEETYYLDQTGKPLLENHLKNIKSTLSDNEETHSNLRNTHRSTQKCLIAVTKRLPFSLEKKKTQRRMSFGSQKQSSMRNMSPFEVNLSGIFTKFESKQSFEDIEDLKRWCKEE